MKHISPSSLLVVLLAFLGVQSISAQEALVPEVDMIEWPTFHDALKESGGDGKIILIDVYADTCPWCRKLQSEIYTQSALQSYVFENFELGRINIGIADDTLSYKGYTLTSAQLGAGFGATGTPTTIFLESDGTYITRLPGFHEYDEFFRVLRFVGSESFRDMSFADYLEEQGISPDAPTTGSTQK
jgi:thioredoxin-related protein